MEGVRILAETAIYAYSELFGIVGSVFIVFGIAIMCASAIDWGISGGGWHVFAILVGLMILAIGVTCQHKYTESKAFSHTEYKVIIEDGVEFNEFLAHYEILDQEGEIYTVKEKGDINEFSQ